MAGRPRSPEAHAAILRAALTLAARDGLRALTMEGVAREAGVGKATVYRRWSSKAALLADALREVATPLQRPETGTARGDYLALVAAQRSGTDGRALARLTVDAAEDPELLAAVREVVSEPRRAVVRALLRDGIARGELRDDLDVDLAVDVLIGPGAYRALLGLPPADPAALWDLVSRGTSASR